MFEQKSLQLALVAVIAAAGAACSTTSSQSSMTAVKPPKGVFVPGARDPNAMVIVAGRIDAQDVRKIDGSTIEVFTIEADGQLTSISVEPVKSDAEGRYQAPIKLPMKPTDLLVVSKQENMKGSGTVLVPSWSVVESIIIAPPISLETKVETDIYFAARSAGIWPDNLGASEIRKVISDRLAAQLRGSQNYDEDIGVMAHAAVGAIHSWYRVLLSREAGLEPSKVQMVLEALGWAQVALDAQMFAAGSQDEVDEAVISYDAAVRSCYEAVGVGPEHLAIAAQASADTLRKFAGAMSDPSRTMLMSEAESLRAKYVTKAVEALFARAGASEGEREAVKTAGSKLEGALQSAPQDNESDIDDVLRSAWSEYRHAVKGKLDMITGKSRDTLI